MKTTLATRDDQAGQALLEFMLVLPILILFLVGILDLGRGIYAYGVISNAARDGAHWGILEPSNATAIQSHALANLSGLDLTQATATAQCISNPGSFDPTKPCTVGNYINVTVTYQFQPATMFFAPLTLTGKSTMTIE